MTTKLENLQNSLYDYFKACDDVNDKKVVTCKDAGRLLISTCVQTEYCISKKVYPFYITY